ncbi:MAG: peptidoglycan DD-metalloendopeptidase family protein, partial [Oscillospiraceae bacterium]
KRLRVMYTTGNASVLGLVLGAEDFTEFLTRTQVASRVVQHDHALIETMQTELAVLSKIKDEIELDKADLESANTQMAQRKGQLDTQVAAAQNQIQDMSKLQQDYAANKAKIDAEMKAAEAEIDAIYDQFESSGEYDGGQMNWPVAGFSYISSTYGWRFNHTDFHTGVDVAGRNAAGQGIYGQPIRAAADGRVIFATTNYVPGKNYGIYVIVDHGGGISTLYGHTSGLAVKTGQEVSRGQTLGYVGSTGWSTGPHLHFEVRINGKYTDPRPYLGLK